MGQFKNLVILILEMSEAGKSPAEIASVLQIGRSVVEYALEVHGSVEAV